MSRTEAVVPTRLLPHPPRLQRLQASATPQLDGQHRGIPLDIGDDRGRLLGQSQWQARSARDPRQSPRRRRRAHHRRRARGGRRIDSGRRAREGCDRRCAAHDGRSIPRRSLPRRSPARSSLARSIASSRNA